MVRPTDQKTTVIGKIVSYSQFPRGGEAAGITLREPEFQNSGYQPWLDMRFISRTFI